MANETVKPLAITPDMFDNEEKDMLNGFMAGEPLENIDKGFLLALLSVSAGSTAGDMRDAVQRLYEKISRLGDDEAKSLAKLHPFPVEHDDEPFGEEAPA